MAHVLQLGLCSAMCSVPALCCVTFCFLSQAELARDASASPGVGGHVAAAPALSRLLRATQEAMCKSAPAAGRGNADDSSSATPVIEFVVNVLNQVSSVVRDQYFRLFRSSV